jgi:hypothetical protein
MCRSFCDFKVLELPILMMVEQQLALLLELALPLVVELVLLEMLAKKVRV